VAEKISVMDDDRGSETKLTSVRVASIKTHIKEAGRRITRYVFMTSIGQ
jgi:hypothetical protein